MSAYHRPESLDEALGLLAEKNLRVAAGCTDLFPATQERALPWPILDITALPDLRGISQSMAGWRIGGATTWTEILRANLPPAFDGLKRAIDIALPQVPFDSTCCRNPGGRCAAPWLP